MTAAHVHTLDGVTSCPGCIEELEVARLRATLAVTEPIPPALAGSVIEEPPARHNLNARTTTDCPACKEKEAARAFAPMNIIPTSFEPRTMQDVDPEEGDGNTFTPAMWEPKTPYEWAVDVVARYGALCDLLSPGVADDVAARFVEAYIAAGNR